MKIWINRAGQNLGTFTLEEVQRGLDQGRFVPTDLGWQEGMETWKPLAEFPDLRMPQPQAETSSLAPLPPTAPDTPPPLAEQTLATVEGEEDGPAWERRQELGFFKALTQTWKEILFNPTVSFSRMVSMYSRMRPHPVQVRLQVCRGSSCNTRANLGVRSILCLTMCRAIFNVSASGNRIKGENA